MSEEENVSQKNENEQNSLTTEQLAARVLAEIKQMSPEERAEVCEVLDEAFGPLDRETETELPLEPQMDDINNAPSAGDCGEPNHTTLAGFPICSKCGHSTRNMNALVCAPCRNRTRLVLTEADRKLLREIGISR